MPVARFDHVSLPTADAERFLTFYKSLGFAVEGEAAWRAGTFPVFSVVFGDNKINVHPEALVARRGEDWYLRGPTAEPGCGDFCVVWEGGLDSLLAMLRAGSVEPVKGPVRLIGAKDRGTSPGVSVYVRDPDENLLEFISYDADDLARYGPPA
jgi:catechol 2,3-dioxygenase-like lactoylglutathione lyase family enzyme